MEDGDQPKDLTREFRADLTGLWYFGAEVLCTWSPKDSHHQVPLEFAMAQWLQSWDPKWHGYNKEKETATFLS